MSTSPAFERAVEAGGIAICRMYPEPGVCGSADVRGKACNICRDEAAASLRAAFPILAEELVKVAREYSDRRYGTIVALDVAAALRAKIEEMR